VIRFLLAGMLLALTSCAAIAGALGFIPVEDVDHGLPAGLGLEDAAGVSGVVSLASVVGLHLYRNYTRTQALRAKLAAERVVTLKTA